MPILTLSVCWEGKGPSSERQWDSAWTRENPGRRPGVGVSTAMEEFLAPAGYSFLTTPWCALVGQVISWISLSSK